ncbi:MAG: TonB-dependent receptor [Acidobacteriota bacterium]
MHRTIRFITCLAVLVVTSVAALAQGSITGAIQGVVRDEKGEALPGVAVIVSSDALISREKATTTDARGIYRFPSLPPGSYTVEAKLGGFDPAKRDGVVVRVGQPIAVDLRVTPTELKEEMTVTADAPLLSTVSNTVSTNFDQVFVKSQPVPRNYYQIAQAAPGVNVDYTSSSGSAVLGFGGTTEGQNAVTLDGVNVADAGGGGHWLLPSIQWMDVIEVGGLGANAEYGGYTGAMINGVTKSGGNSVSGDVEFYYQPSSWVSDNTPDTPDDTFKFSNVAVNVGGPVLKDKLWFFGAAEYWRLETTPLGAEDTSDRKIPRFLGKLSWQVNPTSRLMFMAEYDKVIHDRRGIGEFVLSEASSKQRSPGGTFALHWESLVNDSNFFAAKVTGYDGRDDYLPFNGENTPGRIDDANTGISWQNQDIRQLNHRHIVTLDASWSLFKDNLFGKGDAHAFKFGALYEDAKSTDFWRRNGGFTYFDDSSFCDSLSDYFADPACGADFVERGFGEYNAQPKYNGLHAYAQDTLQIGRFTINPGVRFGRYDGGWRVTGNSSVYKDSFVDPRLGVIWDVRGNGRSALKAHWGRYHEKMYTYLFDREASGQAAIPDQDCFFDSETGQYSDCDTPVAIRPRIGNVDHPYVNELLLTYEQQLGKNMLIGVDLIDRRFRNIMAMVNVNQDYDRVTAVGNPLTGGTLPIYLLQSAPEFVLTTDNGAYRDYRSAVLRFEKRRTKWWSLRSSLTWTDLDGNIIRNNGYGREFEDRNGQVNADGRIDLSYSEWEFKLSALVDLTHGFTLSTQYNYYTGWYWTPFVRVIGLGDYFNASARNINLVPRGSEQLPDRQLLDLRLAWDVSLGDRKSLTLQLECFNCQNKDTVLDVFNRWGSYDLEDGTFSGPRSSYGTPFQIENPRQIRAGARFSF